MGKSSKFGGLIAFVITVMLVSPAHALRPVSSIGGSNATSDESGEAIVNESWVGPCWQIPAEAEPQDPQTCRYIVATDEEEQYLEVIWPGEEGVQAYFFEDNGTGRNVLSNGDVYYFEYQKEKNDDGARLIFDEDYEEVLFFFPNYDSAALLAEAVETFWAGSALDFGSDWESSHPQIVKNEAKIREWIQAIIEIQAEVIKSRSLRYMLPKLYVNTVPQCSGDEELTLGLYYPQCQEIAVDFQDEELAYEFPEELVAVIAHEWGHHLISITDHSLSLIEQEVVADCWSGMVMGFLVGEGMLAEEQLGNSGVLMEKLSNNSESGYHPNKETRANSFLGGANAIAFGDDELFEQYCGSLGQIVDMSKVVDQQ